MMVIPPNATCCKSIGKSICFILFRITNFAHGQKKKPSFFHLGILGVGKQITYN